MWDTGVQGTPLGEYTSCTPTRRSTRHTVSGTGHRKRGPLLLRQGHPVPPAEDGSGTRWVAPSTGNVDRSCYARAALLQRCSLPLAPAGCSVLSTVKAVEGICGVNVWLDGLKPGLELFNLLEEPFRPHRLEVHETAGLAHSWVPARVERC